VNQKLYSALINLAQPVFLLYWLCRGIKSRAYWRHLPERFGFVPRYSADIWIHAVSVGETQAAVPLIQALHHLHPEYRFLLTVTTPTGRHTAQQLLRGFAFQQCYLPIDAPHAVARFFRRCTPKLGIIMETEWWPNLLLQAPCPVALVNARLSQKSAEGYAKYPRLAAQTLHSLRLIAAQDAASAQRIAALGGRDISVTGNVKFDCQAKADHRLSQHLPANYLLAASTRDGEEKLLLKAYARHRIRTSACPVLVIVPRHPERFQEVFELSSQAGLRTAKRSDAHIPPDCEVIIGDSMGEMMAYYTNAAVVLMGGSYLPYGSHNFIEPCALGRLVVVGPSVFNFAEAARSALQQQAITQVSDFEAALDVASAALMTSTASNAHIQSQSTPQQSQSIHPQAQQWAVANQGATQKTLALLRPYLPHSPSTPPTS
jgi:3-deoxy-D-manno-octulosonic-acid transferase